MDQNEIRVLLIEDSPEDARVLQDCLNEAGRGGFRLTHTERFSKAKNLVYADSFDVILLDLSLPDSDGIETVRRAVDALPGLPIIALTDPGDNGLSIQAIQAGAQEYIAKSNINYDTIARSIHDAIARKPVDQLLRESEKRYRSLLDGMMDGVYRSTPDGKFVEVNQAMVDMFGYSSKEEMMEADIKKELYFAEEDRHSLFLDTGKKNVRTFRMRKKDGAEIWIEDHGHYIHDNKGKVAYHEGILRNVSDQKLREEILLESEAQFRTVADMSVAAIFIYQGEKFVYANPASENVTGFSPTELLGMRLGDFIHPDFQGMIRNRQFVSQQGEELPVRHEFKIITKGREERWIEFGARMIQHGGQPAALGVAFDITERKRSEHLQAAVYRIAKAANNAGTLDVLFKMVHEIIGETMYSSNFYIALYDSEKDLISFPYFVDEVDNSPHPRKPLKGLTEHVLRSGKSLLCDEILFKSLVKRGEVEMIGAPSPAWLGVPLIVDNKTTGVMAVQHYSNVNAFGEHEQYMLEFVSSEVARVISHKSAEQQLTLLVTALESAANTIVITNRSGDIIWTNPAFTRMTGYSKEEAIGKNPRILKSGKHENGFFSKLWDTINAGNVWHGEVTNKKKDGAFYSEEMTITPVKNLHGEITNFIAVKQDITERKIIESQFLRSQRMESMGVLAGGIAHDLNNVFSPIMMALELLSHNISDDRRKKMLEILQSSTARGSNIVKQVLTFSRGAEGERFQLQPKHLVREIEDFARQTFPKDIEISLKVATDLWIMTGDATQIHQILLNLCVNARDAMPRGGKLEISAENFVIDSNYSKMNPLAQPGPYILFRVTDTGTGMPESLLDKIFDPFFTTKEVGKGTGLGLSTVMGLVKSYKGIINVYSEVGRGTVFKIYLPAAETNYLKEVAHTEESIPRGNGECIIVVDDEPSIREITKTTLEAFGYTVLTANDGVEAIALFVQNKSRVKLIITDMAMPVLGGAPTIRTMEKIDPNIKIIATSGLLTQKNEIEKLSPILKGFLQKPYTSETLLTMIDAVLRQ